MHTMVSDIPREKVSAAACNSAWCVGQAVRVMLQQARSPPPTPAAWPGVLSPCSLWHPVGSRRRLTLMQSAPNDLLEGAGEWCACGCGVGERGSALWRRRRARVAHESRTRHAFPRDHTRRPQAGGRAAREPSLRGYSCPAYQSVKQVMTTICATPSSGCFARPLADQRFVESLIRRYCQLA